MNESRISKRTLIQIIAILAIFLVLVGIYIYKNSSEGKNSSSKKNPNLSSESANNAFPLKITKVKLEDIKKYGVPTVIDFGSDSCFPCRQMEHVLVKLNSEWKDKAAVQFIDVWKYTDGVDSFPIQVIPTQVFFNADGTPYVPSEKIKKSIQFDIHSDDTSGKHIFTIHQGGLTEQQMRDIFVEMGVK